MPAFVYLLCLAACTACAVVFVRMYTFHRSRLLFWSAVCLVGLAVNNALLVVDLALVPTTDLSVWRAACGAASSLLLVAGLLCELEWW